MFWAALVIDSYEGDSIRVDFYCFWWNCASGHSKVPIDQLITTPARGFQISGSGIPRNTGTPGLKHVIFVCIMRGKKMAFTNFVGGSVW